MELIGIVILSLVVIILTVSVFSLLIYKCYKIKLKNIENNKHWLINLPWHQNTLTC